MDWYCSCYHIKNRIINNQLIVTPIRYFRVTTDVSKFFNENQRYLTASVLRLCFATTSFIFSIKSSSGLVRYCAL